MQCNYFFLFESESLTRLLHCCCYWCYCDLPFSLKSVCWHLDLYPWCLNSQPNTGLPSTNHRRVACSFRDQSLYQIFQISLTSLRQLKNDGNRLTFSCFIPLYFFLLLSPLPPVFLLWTFCSSIFLLIFILVYCICGTGAIRLQELALSLSLKCLSFDFVGTSIDESSEEFGTVQVLIILITNIWNMLQL